MLFFFPRDVLDEIWDLIESVSEKFLTFSFRCNNALRARVMGARDGSKMSGREIFWSIKTSDEMVSVLKLV